MIALFAESLIAVTWERSSPLGGEKGKVRETEGEERERETDRGREREIKREREREEDEKESVRKGVRERGRD